MNKKQKKTMNIIINLSVLLFFIIFIYSKSKIGENDDINKVSFVTENDTVSIPIKENQYKEIKQKTSDYENPNLEVEDQYTILDFTAQENAQEFVDENLVELEDATYLKIDDHDFYVKDKAIITESKEKLLSILIKDPKVLEEYELTGKISDYTIGNKKIIDLQFENTITTSNVKVDKNKIIDSSSELIYQLFHQKKQNIDSLESLKNNRKKYYTVKEGQSFEDVLKITKLKETSFYINNPQYNGTPLLKAGDKILVDKINPILNIVIYYEEKVQEPLEFETIKKNDKNILEGEQKVTQQGIDGKKLVTYKNKLVNGKVVKKQVIDQQIVQKAVNKIIKVGTKTNSASSSGSSSSSSSNASSSQTNAGGFIWPMDSRNISRGVSFGHNGIDLLGPYGSSIYASKSGTVATAGYSPYGGGYEVTINHGGGVYTVYSHMKQQPNVSAGQSVSQGQVIGYMGATGNVTGPHLHFEIRSGASGGAFSGSVLDPLAYLS